MVAEKLPERPGVTDGWLEADMCGLRPGGGENFGIESFHGAEWRSLGGVIENPGWCVTAGFEKDLIDRPPTSGFLRQRVNFLRPAGVVVLAFIDDQGIERWPFLPQGRIAGNFEDDAGEFNFVEIADGFRRTASRWGRDWFADEGAEFEEKFLPSADHDFTTLDLAEGNDAPELGGKSLVVGEEKHMASVACGGVVEGEFEGVPSLAGPGSAVDEVAVRRAIELSATKYCPAQAMLGKAVPMELCYEIYEGESAEKRTLVKTGINTPQ